MSGLPTLIPPQDASIGMVDGKPVTIDLNWYLWLYNIAKQVLGTGQGGGATPASPYDALDAADLFAQTADIPQAYRGIANLAARLSAQGQPDGADIARVRRDLANALLLAVAAPLQDPTPAAQPVQSVTVGASPFPYTALFNGALAISGGTVSAIAITRQGTAVATGVIAGVIPVRRLDKVTITYTVAPTVVFLPQ